MKKLSVIFLGAIIALCVKYLIQSPSISDALIVLSLVSGYGFSVFMENKKIDDLEAIKKEIDIIKSHISTTNMANIKKPQNVNFKF